MEFTRAESALLLKLLSKNESTESLNIQEKIIAYQKSAGWIDVDDDPVSRINEYRTGLAEVMKKMKKHPHDSAEADVLSKEAEEIIQNISDLERQIQGSKG